MASNGVSFDRLEQLVAAEDVPAFLQELARVMGASRSNFKVLLGGLSGILFAKVRSEC